MGWMDKQVTLYRNHEDRTGKAATIGDVLTSAYRIPHRAKGQLVTDEQVLIALRKLDRQAADYQKRKKDLKDLLQCYTPAGCLSSRAKNDLKELSRTGLLQLDFDHNDIARYSLQELKQCVFDLPFVAYCGLSCSGDGFYALVSIAEPDRLSQYADHLHQVLLAYGIKADQTKGKRVQDLRYLSYDSKALIRYDPEILKVKNFFKPPAPKKRIFLAYRAPTIKRTNALVRSELAKIEFASQGHRWENVQRVAYTLGGIGDTSVLEAIKEEISRNPEFAGQEEKYFKCAEDCFAAGMLKQIL